MPCPCEPIEPAPFRPAATLAVEKARKSLSRAVGKAKRRGKKTARTFHPGVPAQPGEKIFRVFAQDVGLEGYSCRFGDMSAKTARAAEARADQASSDMWKGKFLALPFDRQDLWPDGETGLLPGPKKRVRGGRRQR